MNVAAAKFGCDSCGRLFTWSTAIAGRRAKCPCGTEVTVPSHSPASADPPPEDAAAAQDSYSSDDDDAYAIKEEPPVEAIVVRPERTPRPAPSPSGGTRATKSIGYARAKTQREQEKAARAAIAEGAMVASPLKDLWAPTALIALGFGLLVLYGTILGGLSGGVAAVLVFGTFVVIRSVLMLGVAWFSAGWLDVSFGHPLTAALKLFAIMLFVTMLSENCYLIGGATGWMLGWGLGWVSLLVLLCWLFDMEPGAALNFSVLCAMANHAVGWVLVFLAARFLGIF